MRFLYFFIALIQVLTPFCANGQHAEEKAIESVIEKLFEGMRKGDSAMVHGVFTSTVSLATISVDKAKKPVILRESSISDFLDAVGKPHKEVWNEEIWGLSIKVDDNFAQAWCDYAFYIDHTLSHCGVDAFQLFKSNAGWKIFHLADTRRKEPCVIPEKIKAKHRP